MVIAYKALILAMQAILLAQSDPNFRVVDVVSGEDMQQPLTGVRIAQNPQQWNELWLAIRGDVAATTGQRFRPLSNAPRVDFDRNVVVGVFGANMRNVLGFQVVDWSGKGKKAVVRLRPVYNRAGGVVSAVQNPYAVMILTRSKLETDIQMLMVVDNRSAYKTIATVPKTELTDKKPTGVMPTKPPATGKP